MVDPDDLPLFSRWKDEEWKKAVVDVFFQPSPFYEWVKRQREPELRRKVREIREREGVEAHEPDHR